MPIRHPGAVTITAYEIADALGRPRPTEQQRCVIEADLTPALVVAGAGSGKTETMANRVLWLLANGRVGAGQILGLTFTRKAAGELAARIRERISELAALGLVAGDFDAFDPPAVATYNSFSNTIFRDNAILLGRESDGAVLGEASAWQLARRVVVASTDDRLPSLGRTVDTVTKDVLTLSRALSENVAEGAQVQAMAHRFASLIELPPGGRGAYAAVDAMVAKVAALPVLVDLAAQFAEAKARRGFVEYSDQVALALEIIRRVPAVAADYRDRYRVVLLDEYQDTSVVQTWLLSEIFAQHPVMAVGDPNQSIYGWRGASAANLDGFARQFGAVRAAHPDHGHSSEMQDSAVQRFSLSTSWRNGHNVLAVANALVAPLAVPAVAPTAPPQSPVVPESPAAVSDVLDSDQVPRTIVDRLAAGPNASNIPVEVIYEETLPDEADAVAQWLKRKLVTVAGAEPPSAAILFRARKTQGVFIDALRRHDVRYHVLGVGGLLAEAEIADLVSALTVVDDPTAGSELIRLLAGPRWRVAVRDLRGLRSVASWLARRDYAQKPLPDDLREKLRNSVADEEGGSIVDALDFIATARDGHSALAPLSATGRDRLRDAGQVFARLRARSGLDLLDFVTFVEQDLRLDIEVVANDSRPLGGATMDAFFDALTSYLAIDESAALGGFLGWLREAEWRDNLSPRPEEPEPGCVQLMTIHGAKGLERDIVVVPRLTQGELPAAPNEGYTGWLSYGSLPWEFRGDASELPVFAWRSATSRKELLALAEDFAAEVRGRHELEERRLAYVAVTRARHSLLLTGSFWASQSAPRGPSPFLVELSRDGVIGALPVASSLEENPLDPSAAVFAWPADPLGGRRGAVERAAERVRSASSGAEGPWARDLGLLLEERRRRLEDGALVAVPRRVPASRFKDYVTDPVRVAAALRRPMPERPYRATRLGTLFHGWVEQRYGLDTVEEIAGATELIDLFPSESDTDNTPVGVDELAGLQRIFEQSPWGELRPVEVEREIHLPFDGQVIVCKIDAVYFLAGVDSEPGRYQIVDWKTGKAPKDAADLEQKQFQLALYRLAYARWKGIDESRIDAVFYFVSDDLVVGPERLFSEQELVERWRAALGESD